MHVDQRVSWLFNVIGTRNWIAVRTRCWVTEQSSNCFFHIGAQHMLPLARFVMGKCPRKSKNVGEETLGGAMFAHDRFGKFFAFLSKHNAGTA